MKIRRKWYYIKYQLIPAIKHGDGRFGQFYAWLANYFNPVKPGFWRRNEPPKVTLPDGYIGFEPCAYWVGEGWALEWSAVHCDGSFEGLSWVIKGFKDDDGFIYDWPFLLPVASESDFVRAGFNVL